MREVPHFGFLDQQPENYRVPEPETVSAEQEKKPEKLFRAVSINPEELSVERLRQQLMPGTVNESDPTKVHDGNELGVYMSTNRIMVESAYAKGGRGVSYLETPTYESSRGMKKNIELPGCGVVYEISTNGLKIRKPEITAVLKGVYNNGFQGDEWIADTVDSQHYRVSKLILSRWANDSDTFTVTVEDTSDESLQKAIETIKQEFSQRRRAAEEFREFLKNMDERSRMNEFKVRREWDKYQAAASDKSVDVVSAPEPSKETQNSL